MDLSNFESKNILNRIKIALQSKNFEEVAEHLSISPATINTWRHRGKIPELYLLKVVQMTGVSLEWLLSEDKPTFHISGGKGVVAQQTNHGDGGQHNTFGSKKEKSVKKEENNIDEGTFILFKEAYMKAEKNKEINRLRLYLMEF